MEWNIGVVEYLDVRPHIQSNCEGGHFVPSSMMFAAIASAKFDMVVVVCCRICSTVLFYDLCGAGVCGVWEHSCDALCSFL
jgi:hypothetical protein